MVINKTANISKVIVLKTALGIYRLFPKDILYFEAANKEILVIWSDVTKAPLKLSISIGRCEVLLGNHAFLRIHRSYIVNRSHIFYFNFTESYVTLYGEKTLSIARNRRKLMAEWLLEEGKK
ncbi:MAG: LytR/AlgR family response regulator transcription factor [Chitinophagales bacterium]